MILNRVKCLISTWRLADLYYRKLILYWPKNHTCGANFSDLFEFAEVIAFRQIIATLRYTYTLTQPNIVGSPMPGTQRPFSNKGDIAITIYFTLIVKVIARELNHMC